ncbi:hypothetical protein KY290_004962 [Solanum tuberosum]|uniref:Isopentenyltransferase n=1 Tax=Solanum tuberosum TaxID=4113 RepID=A0ABQ7WD84_SOLTU|nr:hypothetical protein KY284_006550 [Solanum tuberosum]KAH0723812.1 hypothetical protein KY289_006856 [Solanum tuberosum]KAH0778535.1 hypothetical protein KY290_004962 [Solanum tuberosum]
MQVYKGLDIVTNKITHAEKQGVRHYLLEQSVLNRRIDTRVDEMVNAAKMNTFINNNNKLNKKKVVFIMGATGTGKSRLSVDLATHFRGEIINSDKMQVYKGLDVVTNKITHAEKQVIRHYFLGEIEPDSDFTAEDFCLKSIVYIENILKTQCVPIIVGGSNSYIQKLVEDPGWWMRCGKFSCQMQITPNESDGPLVSLKWPAI